MKKEIDEYQAELNPLFQEMEGCFDILMPREFDNVASSNTTTRDEKGKERMDAEEDEEEEIEWDSTHDTAEGKAKDDLDWDAFEEDDAEQDGDVDDVLRRHGIGNSGYELNITFDKSFADLTRDEADEEDSHGSASEGTQGGEKRPDSGKEAIIECLRNDLLVLKRRYIPLIDDWYDVLLRVEFASAAQSDEGLFFACFGSHFDVILKIMALQKSRMWFVKSDARRIGSFARSSISSHLLQQQCAAAAIWASYLRGRARPLHLGRLPPPLHQSRSKSEAPWIRPPTANGS